MHSLAYGNSNEEGSLHSLSVLKFDLYLRGSQCSLCCDHYPLEQLLSCGIKVNEVNHCSLELSDHNLTFVYIKENDNILADAIFRLKMLEMYMKLIEN